MLRIIAGWRLFSCFAALSLVTALAGAQAATIDAPASAPSGSKVRVQWTGRVEDFDKICVVPAGAPDATQCGNFGTFTFGKSPVAALTPEPAGEYELRYQTGETGTTLARAELDVVPAKQEPGLLQVAAAESTLSSGGAVEIILDASGSMLQRIGSERRIDTAKQTLTQLTSKIIPAGTPFALARRPAAAALPEPSRSSARVASTCASTSSASPWTTRSSPPPFASGRWQATAPTSTRRTPQA